MLNVNNLCVKYGAGDGEGYALQELNFSARPGERVALIGANGAGKTTLLLTLCGVLSPDRGSIRLEDVVLEKGTLRELRKKIGMVFQNPDNQLFMPTIYEDAAFGPRNNGLSEMETESKIDEVFSRLGISHLKNRISHKLSGGEKRLAALAGILVMEPSLLLLDEPSSFLDPLARRKLINILDGLPHTLLMSTHDLDMALDFCGRVILLKDGRIWADGPAANILTDKALLEECGLELPLSLQGR